MKKVSEKELIIETGELKVVKKDTEVYVKIKNPNIDSAENYVRMVGTGHLKGCILIGPPGLGKTKIVTHTLSDIDVPYILYGGHITLAEIYEFLWENNDKLIFFDDVSQIVNKVEIMEMLKQALNNTGSRVIHYRSKNVLNPGVPNHFEFTGRVIMAFNLMDKKNPNVKAIMDRCPPIELNFSRKEILEAMYLIAKAQGGGLLEYEKAIVTKEIEDYTDSSMDISLRKQAQAFKIYSAFKDIYGEGNIEWIREVHRLFGKKMRSWIEELLINLVGIDGKIKRTELVKEIALARDVSGRTAHRKIKDYIDMDILFTNKEKWGEISLKPW